MLIGTPLSTIPIHAAAAVAEGNDFATQVLQDPWDMTEFTDVSQYFNSDDNSIHLSNPVIGDGLFTANTSGTDPLFFILFPGYRNAISVGKVGDRLPINSSVYKCMYFAMKVNSGSSPTGPDPFQVFWFSDKDMTKAMGSYTNSIAGSPGARYFNLYSVNLASPPAGKAAGAAWTSQANWKGLRIDPTIQSGVDIAVDWVRLTDCTPRNYTVSWSGNKTNASIWALPTHSADRRKIRIASNLSGTSATLDLQGMQPGSYELYLGLGADTVGTTYLSTVVINQAPIVKITRPSFTSGASYDSQIGNPWDMSGPPDATNECTNSYFKDGALVMDTPTGANQPSHCVNDGIADPKVFLNSPQQANTGEYRYFTFRMKTDGNWQKFGKGMMARFIWVSNSYHMVTWDIPFDVGWNTLSIDLHDSFAGTPVQCYPSPCPGGASWLNSKTAGSFRFDPNENISGTTFHQELDSVTLTKMDQVKKGTRFPIGISLNKLDGSISLNYFYTTNTANPRQNAAAVITPQTGGGPPPGSRFIFIPMVANGSDIGPSASSTLWDTSNVAAGTYYICVEAKDNLNTTIYCSEAPVNVTN